MPLTLEIVANDLGPVGTRKYPATPYPRPFVTVSVACVIGPTLEFGSMTLPQEMTPAEWDLLLDWLAVTRQAFVTEDPS